MNPSDSEDEDEWEWNYKGYRNVSGPLVIAAGIAYDDDALTLLPGAKPPVSD